MQHLIFTLIIATTPAHADDISDAITKPFTEKKTRKIAGPRAVLNIPPLPPQPVIPKKWPETEREKCNKNASDQMPAEMTTKKFICAKNIEEVKMMFPLQYAALQGLRGSYSDNLPGDYEERVSRFQEEHPDNYKKNDQVPLQIVQHSLKIDGNESELKIQLTDFDERAKVQRSAVEKVELCQSAEGYFLKTNSDKRIPIRFQGKKCLWVAMNGIWTAQRKMNDEAPDFFEPVARTPAPTSIQSPAPAGTK